MSIVGCYGADFYCDHPEHKHWEKGWAVMFTGHTWEQTARAARRAGWLIGRRQAGPDTTCPGTPLTLCPLHSGKRKGPASP